MYSIKVDDANVGGAKDNNHQHTRIKQTSTAIAGPLFQFSPFDEKYSDTKWFSFARLKTITFASHAFQRSASNNGRYVGFTGRNKQFAFFDFVRTFFFLSFDFE